MMNLYTTVVYKTLGERYPYLWEIRKFIGEEEADQLISAYVDDDGNLSPHPIIDMIFSSENAEEKLQRNIDILWSELTDKALAKWYKGLTKDQAQTLCEAIGYQNQIRLCGVADIPMSSFPEAWKRYHPDEGFLPIEDEWFQSIT